MEVFPIHRELLFNPNDLEAFFEEVKPDYIIHTAAYGNHSNQEDEAMIVFVNIIGTFNMLNASKELPYKIFINFGSSSEYGRKSHAMKENDFPETETFYGASKVGGTYIAQAFAKKYDKRIVTVRPFSVYGEGEAEFRFIPTIIRSIKEDSMMPFSEGFHDWIYIEDFVEAIYLILKKLPPSQIINIGTGEQHANSEIIEIIEGLKGKKVALDINHKLRPFDSHNWLANAEKIKRLGWEPKTTLFEGLEKVLTYYEK